MNKTIHDIIDAIVFIAGLSIIFRLLGYFEIDLNYRYKYIWIILGFLILWIAAKMIFRRLIAKSKKERDESR